MNENPYNFVVPVVGPIIVYLVSFFISKSKIGQNNRFLKRAMNNFTWNSVMIMLLLIPVGGFGVFMVARYTFPALREINFDFLYWHVEFSLAFSSLVAMHIIVRLKQYILPVKNLTRKD